MLEGDNEVEDTAFFIHSRIHRSSACYLCFTYSHAICHLHYTSQGWKLEMMEQNALLFDGRVAYDDEYEGLALASDEGDRLARKIGNKSILFMASHGVVAGPTVADAFNDLYIRRASMFQVLAVTGGELEQFQTVLPRNKGAIC